jgi:membrane protease YdiL (CAAX protease family)
MPILAKYNFQKYFNRSVLISAVVLVWPFARWMGVQTQTQPRFRPQSADTAEAGIGFLVGILAISLMAFWVVYWGSYEITSGVGFMLIIKAFLTAWIVAMLEEWLFRGAILTLLRQSMEATRALWVCSAIFAAVHFLKPNPAIRISEVSWDSGWLLVPEMFHQFTQPILLMGGFGTLLVLGWVLGVAALRTRSLWLSIGLHAGIVFIKLIFTKISRLRHASLPWIGSEIQIGLFPVGMLLLTALFVYYWTGKVRPASSA